MCPHDADQGRLDELVKEFELSGGAIVDELGRTIEARQVPNTLYHYTDAKGLEGILTHGTLWFTNIFQLNDPSELKHGIELGLDLVGAAARKSGKPEHLVSAQIFRDAAKKVIKSSAHYFVCCLSYHADDLNQWRNYADNGRGYALAFDKAVLEKAFVGSGPNNVSTFPVTYDDAHMRDWHQRHIDNWLPYVSTPRDFSGLSDKQITSYQGDLGVQLALQIFQTAIFHKHECYRAEEEYRFLQLFAADKDVPDLRTRTRNGEEIQYRAFDWKTPAAGALKKIVIGPSADKKTAANFAYDCLKGFQTPDSLIGFSSSEVPYRS